MLPHQCVYRCFSEESENCTAFFFDSLNRRGAKAPRLLFSFYFFKSAAMTRFMASMPTFTAPEVSSVMGIASPAFSRS